MFWDQVVGVYGLFANVINRKTHQQPCHIMEGLIEYFNSRSQEGMP